MSDPIREQNQQSQATSVPASPISTGHAESGPSYINVDAQPVNHELSLSNEQKDAGISEMSVHPELNPDQIKMSGSALEVSSAPVAQANQTPKKIPDPTEAVSLVTRLKDKASSLLWLATIVLRSIKKSRIKNKSQQLPNATPA